jgi:hemerythrin-like metal-binding protein
MATWIEDQWKCGDPAIDVEHQKLHQMISAMTAVVRNDPGLGLAIEAVEVLSERMRLHFRMEEALAAKINPLAAEELKQDHQRLLRLLPPVSDALRHGGSEKAKSLMAEFRTQLDKHDREMDIPLFRK